MTAGNEAPLRSFRLTSKCAIGADVKHSWYTELKTGSMEILSILLDSFTSGIETL
jgi:hypothetical protein